MLAICTDGPALIRAGHALHGLGAPILADPELVIVDRFGLRNQGVTVRPPGVPGLPVPTTLLVDAAGIVRWIDQSAHYYQRSDPAIVNDAVAALA